LIAGAAALASGPVLDGALAEVTDLAEMVAQLLVMRRERRFFHAAQFNLPVNLLPVVILDMNTPFFPAWRPRLAPLRSGLSQAVHPLRRATLCQIEQTLGPALPDSFLKKSPRGPHSRCRVFCLGRTFWGWVWQILQANTSCREVLRQVQALQALLGLPAIDENTSAYCQARSKLPTALLEQMLQSSCASAQTQSAATTLLQGRPIKVMDGSSVRLPDTEQNRHAYPASPNQYSRPGFPILKILTLFCLRSGALLARATGNLDTAETRLLTHLAGHLQPGDILTGDRAYGLYVMLHWTCRLGADLLARLNCRSRRVDFRQCLQELGQGDALFLWHKPKVNSKLFSPEQWEQVPQTMVVRVVRRRLQQKGFRTRELTVVTTLLDPQLYPAQELLAVYFRRWRLEMCLDDLKTTLAMAQLTCRTPELVHKELLLFLITHNLLRWIMAQAADLGPPLERISFKGTLDTFRQWSTALPQLRGPAKGCKQRKLWRLLLTIIAADGVPERPRRKEPRAVKLKSKYPRLTKDRHRYVDRWSRNKKRRIQRAKKSTPLN